MIKILIRVRENIMNKLFQNNSSESENNKKDQENNDKDNTNTVTKYDDITDAIPKGAIRMGVSIEKPVPITGI